MFRLIGLFGVVALAIVTGIASDDDKRSQEPPRVVKDSVRGSIHHGSGSPWDRIVGKVTVIDARTLEFADGTRMELDMVAPELDQQGTIDGNLYPCGREAAEFLRKRIGDRPVTIFYRGGNTKPYVGDENIEHMMIVNGWALADHSTMHAAEIIARENRRGFWRGEFVDPDEWRQGKRLAAEK